jgi:biopolymer transport protein TolR
VRFATAKTAHEKEVTFDVTNMIDVVLLLIIFFMLTAQFAKSNQAPMDLPREKGDSSERAGEASLVIDVGVDGRLSMLGRPADMAEVSRAVQSALGAPGASPLGLDLVIRADRSCPAVHLNRLAEALADLGVRTWKLATQGEGG